MKPQLAYVPPSRFVPAMRPSGAVSKGSPNISPVNRKSAGGYESLQASRESVDFSGLVGGQSSAPTSFGPALIVEGMPHYGQVFLDSNPVNGRWLDDALTLWAIDAAPGRHNVIVVAPSGERATGTVVVYGPSQGGPGRQIVTPPATRIAWPQMKRLAPVNAALGGYGASSGMYAPSGALTPTQVLDYQGTLAWLGHLPASAVTGREPVASAAVLRAFQTNYNAEQANRNYRFSPRTLTVDGQWGPATQQALQNYVASARAAAAARGASIPQVPVDIPMEADGWHSAPGPGAQASITPIGKPGVTTMVKGGSTPAAATPATAVRPSTSAPAVIPPSQQPPASTFPLVPVLAIGGGVAAIGLALYVRSRRRKGK